MEEIVKQPVLNLVPLDEQTRNIAQQILDEQDVDKVKDLTALFNLNARKRNVMRVIKMNDLLDTVTDKVVERFEKTPDNFSNDDLLKYMQVTSTAMEKAQKELNLVDETPAIHLQQNNQVNVNIIDSMPRESRERVMEAIQAAISGGISKDAQIVMEDVQDELHEETGN